jgi:plasmid stabilization system protein ParE
MYQIEITARAQADADAAYAWIAEHLSPERAERWYQGLFKQIETLTRQPQRCPLALENYEFPEEIRVLLYGKRANKYKILFTIRATTVVILYVHHGARDKIEP